MFRNVDDENAGGNFLSGDGCYSESPSMNLVSMSNTS